MCGFLFTSYKLNDEEIKASEEKVTLRGPDLKNIERKWGCTYVHYLLHITGEKTKQPITSEEENTLLYNGEIYNFLELGQFKSDGYAVLSAYESEGLDGIRQLDGEFSGVIHDAKKNKLIIFRDAFGTKPIHFSRNEKGIIVCSYFSQAKELGFKEVYCPSPNSILEIDIETCQVKQYSYKNFDLRQHKNSYDDWYFAFRNAIKKRTDNQRVKYFIGLSSGYDSGLISAVLNDINVEFNSYSIQAAEDIRTIKERAKILKHNEYFHLSEEEYQRQRDFLIKNCEPYESPRRSTRPNGYSVLKDKGAIGTGIICEKAVNAGCKVYISGQGSDEIISDYGHAGRMAPGFLHSTIAGFFPSDLKDVFPWENFFEGTQREFIAKDENVGGTYGIETRYPFLDPNVVQEFLWLDHRLKNASYKAPIEYSLNLLNYPIAPDGLTGKVGFRANSNFRR